MDRNIYDDQILQWAARSDHRCTMEIPDGEAAATNPLCGDRVTIQVMLEGDRISRICYQVRGCVLCKASCAQMAPIVTGFDYERLHGIREEFAQYLQGTTDDDQVCPQFRMFSPVRSHRSRYRCLLLPYDAALKALATRDG